MGTKSHCVKRNCRGCKHESFSLRHVGLSEDALLASESQLSLEGNDFS